MSSPTKNRSKKGKEPIYTASSRAENEKPPPSPRKRVVTSSSPMLHNLLASSSTPENVFTASSATDSMHRLSKTMEKLRLLEGKKKKYLAALTNRSGPYNVPQALPQKAREISASFKS
jgi:hypothetical protein